MFLPTGTGLVHPESQVFFIRTGALFQPDSILELGSCDVNGPCRILFRTATRYVGVDIADGPGVDVVADAATYRPEPAHDFDLVISASTFEHTPAWPQIVETAFWHSRRAAAFSTVTSPFPKHAARGGPLGPDEFYQDVPELELRAAMFDAGFVRVESTTGPKGDVLAIGYHE